MFYYSVPPKNAKLSHLVLHASRPPVPTLAPSSDGKVNRPEEARNLHERGNESSRYEGEANQVH